MGAMAEDHDGIEVSATLQPHQQQQPQQQQQQHDGSQELVTKQQQQHDRISLSQRLREWRHNPCLMNPLSALVVMIICLFSLLVLAMRLPEFVLGMVLGPILKRGNWFVEFLYPSGVARWVHFFLMRWMDGKNNNNNNNNKSSSRGARQRMHSRVVEMRFEVVQGRVYIHPIPQFLDNIAYLVVCVPDENKDDDVDVIVVDVSTTQPPPTTTTTTTPVVAFLVDCGDAGAVLSHVDTIRDLHYPGRTIEIQSIVSTHKHHDHTAGNKAMRYDKTKKTAQESQFRIYGGAIERVPCCTDVVQNGDYIPLPRSDDNDNDMNELCELEVIAVPSHTRGSLAYTLRNKSTTGNNGSRGRGKSEAVVVSHLFTGDVMFSGGMGAPFEADSESARDRDVSKKKSSSPIKAAAGNKAMERCFAEIVVRSLGPDDSTRSSHSFHYPAPSGADRMLLFPGHEYTDQLLQRQFDPKQPAEEKTLWYKVEPSIFFYTASQYYLASHRRSLPASGKLLTVPSPMSRELKINPLLRGFRMRARDVIDAVRMWHDYFSQAATTTTTAITTSQHGDSDKGNYQSKSDLNIMIRTKTPSNGASLIQNAARAAQLGKTPSTDTTWNLSVHDVNRPVFSTVYAADLDSIILDLHANKISPRKAAERLVEMRSKLNQPTVERAPIPGTLPGERTMYLGILGLTLLGSPPCAFTASDAEAMNLPCPVDSSDCIMISKSRLLCMFQHLGLLSLEENESLVGMLDQLWLEASKNGMGENDNENHNELHLKEDEGQPLNGGGTPAENSSDNNHSNLVYNATSDVETPTFTMTSRAKQRDDEGDEVELGLLKWTLYGIEANRPSWFQRFCMPCGSGGGGGGNNAASLTKLSALPNFRRHPANSSRMRRSNGEVVRHDVAKCPMCRTVVGCPLLVNSAEHQQQQQQEAAAGGSLQKQQQSTTQPKPKHGAAAAAAASASATATKMTREQESLLSRLTKRTSSPSPRRGASFKKSNKNKNKKTYSRQNVSMEVPSDEEEDDAVELEVAEDFGGRLGSRTHHSSA